MTREGNMPLLARANALCEAGALAEAFTLYRACERAHGCSEASRYGQAKALYGLGDADRAARLFEAGLAAEDPFPWLLACATIAPGVPSWDGEKVLAVRRALGRYLRKNCPWRINTRPSHGPAGRRRLRVGYVSAHFQQPNYMLPVWGLINAHDRARFEVDLFSDAPVSGGFPGYNHDPADTVHVTQGLGNEEVTRAIRRAGMDMLVDLNGYSAPHRLALFARHPAPVTLAWFNLYATSGLPGLDYIVGDAEAVPREEERLYSERVLRLPQSYLTFMPPNDAPEVARAPSLSQGTVTYGSLVSQYKITAPVLDAWAGILERCPDARLLLANRALDNPLNRSYLRRAFHRRGVPATQVMFRPPAEHDAFLRYYDAIDVALDAFPYSGGTTTMEALWQGVPVLTIAGDRWAARTTRSILASAGLGAYIADDPGDYVRRAIAIANDPSTPRQLDRLRKGLRAKLRRSPVCDTTALAQHMETLYRRVWHGSAARTERHCRRIVG